METNRLSISSEDERLLTLVGLLFESAAGAQEVLQESFLPGSKLNAQLFGPLLRVSRTEGARMRMSDLAAQCRYTPSAMTRVADRLEMLGFAHRDACPSDRRVVYLAISEAGREAVAQAVPGHLEAARSEVFAALDAAELDQFERLIRKIRDAVHPCADAVTADAPGAHHE